jgi:UDP-N-acetylmuramoyl-L-alanyl-D-glutamate--2,6-diaminopimelate ligase
MKFKQIIKSINYNQLQDRGNPDIDYITYDSRKVKPHTLFVAVPGQKSDGHSFISQAVSRGASAVIGEKNSPAYINKISYIQVPDSRIAMAQASAAFYNNPSDKLQLVGVTGTNGKTTILYMIKNILTDSGRKTGVIGTINYEIGNRIIPALRTTPESSDLNELLSQMVNIGCKTAITEVSSHAILQNRIYGLDFNIAVFTNLTQDHLDYHKSMNNYFDAKARFFYNLNANKNAYAVINSDDSWGQCLLQDKDNIPANVLTYGINSQSDIRARNIKIDAEFSSFTVESPWENAEIKLRLLGRYNISNALAAFAVCAVTGIKPAEIAASLAALASVRGRLEKIDVNLPFKIFVDYAHTDDALKNVLATLREITTNRLIVVFGCGGDRDRNKRHKMGAAAQAQADYIIITTDNPRTESPDQIIADITSGFDENALYRVIPDRNTAIHTALQKAQSGDIILIAGKGHETYQEFADTVVPFDDREVVKKYLNIN